MNVHSFLDHVLGPSCSQTLIFTIDLNDFWNPSRAHFVPHRGQKINSRFRPGTLCSASDFIKRLKNVKLSSKSGFSPQELQNLSRDTHMKRINPQQLPNLTQDTNMKRLNYVKLASQSGFRPHELPMLSQETITSIFVSSRTSKLISKY